MYTAEQYMFYPTFKVGKRNVGYRSYAEWARVELTPRPYQSGDLMPGDVITIGESPLKYDCRTEHDSLVLIPRLR